MIRPRGREFPPSVTPTIGRGSGFVVDTDFIPNVTLHEGLNEFSDEAVMRVENLRKIVKLDATITPEIPVP